MREEFYLEESGCKLAFLQYRNARQLLLIVYIGVTDCYIYSTQGLFLLGKKFTLDLQSKHISRLKGDCWEDIDHVVPCYMKLEFSILSGYCMSVSRVSFKLYTYSQLIRNSCLFLTKISRKDTRSSSRTLQYGHNISTYAESL